MIFLLAGAVFIFMYIALSAYDGRIPLLTTFVLMAGVLIYNKGFATIGLGPVFIMDGLLGLALLGVFVNPWTRRNLLRPGAPTLVLGAFLTLGVIDLLRGHRFGLNAAQDSVISFYSIAALLPIALFPTMRSLLAFLRLLVLPLVVGSILFLFEHVFSTVGPGSTERFTPHTAAAFASCGLIFLLLLPERLSPVRAGVLALLGAVVVLASVRAIWVGCVLAAAVLLIAARRDRGKVVRSGAFLGLAATVTLLTLTALGSPYASRLENEARSLLFSQSLDEVAATGDDPERNARWRITAWSEVWEARIKPNLLVGEGFGRPALEGTTLATAKDIREDPRVQLHNGYLSYLLRAGVVGLALFFAFVLPPMVRLGRRARSAADRRERMLSLAVLGSLVLFMGDIALAPVIEGPMGGIPFWFLVGTGCRVASLGRARVPARNPRERRPLGLELPRPVRRHVPGSA